MTIIGIGNEFRGDDAAGILVIRQLKDRYPHLQETITLKECSGDLSALLEDFSGKHTVILIDTAVSGHPPGTIQQWEISDAHNFDNFPVTSTHNLSLSEIIHLATLLKKLPERLVIYTIEGEQFGMGERPSPPVLRAVDQLVTRLVEELT